MYVLTKSRAVKTPQGMRMHARRLPFYLFGARHITFEPI